jgi:hypothetical protein
VRASLSYVVDVYVWVVCAVFALCLARLMFTCMRMHGCTGTIMTSVSNVVVNPEGDFYGAKLETPSVHPGMAAWGRSVRRAAQRRQAGASNSVCLSLSLSLFLILFPFLSHTERGQTC